MSFDTYVINLEKDKENYEILAKKLQDVNIESTRFNAIYGKEVKDEYDEYISKNKDFIPKSCIGIGLSHYFVCKEHFSKDKPKVAMILEDDATILFNDKKEIEQILKNAPKDWDIILLYTQGITNYKEDTWEITPISGSSIGYLINENGYKKHFKDFKVLGHVDLQRIKLGNENKDFKIYKTPKPMIMPNSENISNTSSVSGWYRNYLDTFLNEYFHKELESDITNYTGSMVSKYKLFRIPDTDIELDLIQLVFLFIIFNVLILVLIGKNKIESFFFSIIYFISVFFCVLTMTKFLIQWNKVNIIQSLL